MIKVRLTREVKITPEELAEKTGAFETSHQSDAIIALYKHVFPEWDAIEKMDGSPEVSRDFWIKICDMFMKFDRKYHPNVMNGGMWMNSGFSVDEKLANNVIKIDFEVTMKEE